MENLLNSRLCKDEEPSKLQNLSPEKFGKGAYAQLTYTPSKLADNVLFKEAVTMKKVEEGSSKHRESEALNNFMKDRLKQLQEERDGIEQSLTQQIVMYKKMLHQMETKHEQRIKEVQKGFNDQMQRILDAKEEEAKYSQSEKELLENRIYELQNLISDLKDELSHGGNNFDTLTKEHEKLQIHFKNLTEKLEDTEKKMKEDANRAKAEFQELSRRLYNTEVEAKSKQQKLQLERQKQRENLERLHRIQLQKTENKRQQEAIMKNQELKDLAQTFEAEANRLNDIIGNKDRVIENLSNSVSEEKQKILDLTRGYTNEISNLAHQKARLREEVENLSTDNIKLKDNLKACQNTSSRDILNLEAYIEKLKDQLELNQVNLIREKDRNGFFAEDLQRENGRLRLENEKIAALSGQNSVLCKQIRNLKELLLQSSLEMEKCKDQFLRLGREKDHLLIKLRQMGMENETLHRLKVERQEEARGWRDSYYLNRR